MVCVLHIPCQRGIKMTRLNEPSCRFAPERYQVACFRTVGKGLTFSWFTEVSAIQTYDLLILVCCMSLFFFMSTFSNCGMSSISSAAWFSPK
jgi:hypothetical protein